ncbi:hypothetical protein ACTXT7_016250 [Hymenolepis weldensis]
MAEQFVLGGYDLRFDRHRCGIAHEKFDPQRHGNMYINLDQLPDTAPMMRFDKFFTKPTHNEEDIDIPLIIAGPIYALSELIWEDEDQFTFIGELDCCSYRDPQPYNDDCPVCKAVIVILTLCKTYADCKRVLKKLKPLLIYQVCHEIWCRLQPQPLAIEGSVQVRFDSFVYSHITRFYDITRPSEDGVTHPVILSWPERREVMLEWTNGYAFQTHHIVSEGPNESRMQRTAAGFILTFMLRFLRGYTTILAPELSNDPNSPFFFIDAIKALYEKELNIIDGVVLHLYPTLLRIPGCPQTDDDVKKLLKNVMRTMLIMNVQEAFMPGVKVQQYYRHTKVCEMHPGMCICRWAKYLERNPKGSPYTSSVIPCPQRPVLGTLPREPSDQYLFRGTPYQYVPRLYIRKGRGIDMRVFLQGW